MMCAEYGGSLFQVYSVYDQTHDPSVSTWMLYQKATGIKNRKISQQQKHQWFSSSKQNIKHIQFFPSQLLCFWSFRQPHWSRGSCCLSCKQRLQRPVKDLFKADSVVKVSGGYFANVMPPLLLQNLSSSHKLRVLYVLNLCSSFASDEIPHGQRIKGK